MLQTQATSYIPVDANRLSAPRWSGAHQGGIATAHQGGIATAHQGGIATAHQGGAMPAAAHQGGIATARQRGAMPAAAHQGEAVTIAVPQGEVATAAAALQGGTTAAAHPGEAVIVRQERGRAAALQRGVATKKALQRDATAHPVEGAAVALAATVAQKAVEATPAHLVHAHKVIALHAESGKDGTPVTTLISARNSVEFALSLLRVLTDHKSIH
eukprot:TRINITY_DN4747_c0_g1_i1.p1 TRINITY_DN4747_c0_g1~~TRINITY_DN4747_c0_g1_i1.p1  ORF type:complete len:215 (-),score=15.13 TRINITY_DN4747_c0_g1_i1:136-780(-)